MAMTCTTCGSPTTTIVLRDGGVRLELHRCASTECQQQRYSLNGALVDRDEALDCLRPR